MTGMTSMILTGKHNVARVFTDPVETSAVDQIRALCDSEDFAGSKIRVMPDVHAGKGSVVGLTMTLDGKVDPNMVGVDIGCGMDTSEIRVKDIDFAKLDAVIRERVPSGFNVRETPLASASALGLDKLRCAGSVNLKLAERSLGTLGGGNHFIEVERGGDGRHCLVIHSGSRKLGLEVAAHYSRKAEGRGADGWRAARAALIARLKEEGRELEIADELRAMPRLPAGIPFVSGADFDDYIHDMKIAQGYASRNRETMRTVIAAEMGWKVEASMETVHNYIDTDSMILRKGAVSAKKGEPFLVPINMKEGSLLCTGRGNDDWNCSGPHGAGRLMSRSEARRRLSVDDFVRGMEEVWTTSAGADTLDEAPGAYRSMEDIVRAIGPTAEIRERLFPVYSFKAGGERRANKTPIKKTA
ncbi:MAG: RtcB family protein [Deltaproteobacteria bacterium]|jgi:RNA-splicing ligase RtcB|nr:RtcB family protein [Deltaproteobacteria bacterium]